MQISPEKQKKKFSLWGTSPRIFAWDKLRPSFTKLAVQLTEKGISSPEFRWASTAETALSLLRSEPVDCILYAEQFQFLKNEDQQKRFLQNIQATRTSNPITPILILADHLPENLWRNILKLSCEVFISKAPWESHSLYSFMDHCIRNSFIQKEHSRLTAEKNQQLKNERDEAERLLAQQRSIVAEIERITSDDPEPNNNSRCLNLETEIQNQCNSSKLKNIANHEKLESAYSELLRSYVVMGSDNLSINIKSIAQQFFDKGLTVRETYKIHLNQVDKLVKGLGKKSSRQIISRSDILAMELMIQLCDLYRY